MGMVCRQPRRVACLTLVILTAAACGGCPVWPGEVVTEPVTGYDFSHLASLAETAMDVTDYGWGLLPRQMLCAKYGCDDQDVTLISLDGFAFQYLLITSPAQREHTVVLPGTSNADNLQRATRSKRIHDEELGVWLHEGYQELARALRADLESRLQVGHSVTLVGYSLGGATAVITAHYLARDGVALREVVTLGQPMVTDAAGAAVLGDVPLLRLIGSDDGIPRLRGGGYAHFGPGLILLDGPYVIELPSEAPEVDAATEFLVELADSSIRDHDSYVRRLQDKIGRVVHALRFADPVATEPAADDLLLR